MISLLAGPLGLLFTLLASCFAKLAIAGWRRLAGKQHRVVFTVAMSILAAVCLAGASLNDYMAILSIRQL